MRNVLARKRTTGEPSKTVPYAPGGLPVVGHAVQVLRDPWGFLRSLPAHGDMVRVSLGPIKAVMVCDPELTSQILLDDRTYDKGGVLFDRAREVFGDGLVTCPHAAGVRQSPLNGVSPMGRA